MECLEVIFKNFLNEQKEKLEQSSFDNYREVITLFKDYLNGYAYQNLANNEYELFLNKYNEDNKEFCELFSIKQVGMAELNEFLSYFIIRKIMRNKEIMNNTGIVLSKFIKWLKTNSYIEDNKFNELNDIVQEIKDVLPQVEKLSELLYKNEKRNSIYTYDKYEEDNFIISRIEQGKLWLESFLEENSRVGPVEVSEEISSLAQEGWSVYLVLGQKDGSWFIVESGNVYPD